MAQVAIELDSQERRTFQRLLGFSALLHLAGFAALAWVPSLPSMSVPAAIAVNLVAAPPPANRPSAKPAPPAPRPKPRPPKPAPVVLPTEATVPKPKPRDEALPPEPEAPVQEDYTDVLASLREELGEEAPQPTPEPVPQAAAAPGGSGPGVLVSPELRAWMTAAKIRIKDNWVVPPSFRMAAIVAEVRLEVDAGGALVSDPRLVAGSGNPFYDDGVLRSIRKADPLPPPPEPGVWTFRFVSDDY